MEYETGNNFIEKSFRKCAAKASPRPFFLSSPVSFNRQNYQKQKGPGTSDQWLFRLQNKFR